MYYPTPHKKPVRTRKTAGGLLSLILLGVSASLPAQTPFDIVVCPPFTALSEVSKAILSSKFALGAQNMSEHNMGAYTGEIAAQALSEGDELVMYDCDLDIGRHIKENIFNFAKHRRVEHYGILTSQTGVVLPPEE